MLYSPSRLKSARACTRKFHYHYNCGYREVMKKPWLRIGSAVDDLLAIYDTEGFDVMMSKVNTFFTDPHERIIYKQLLIHYNEVFKEDVLPPVEINGCDGNQWHFNLPIDIEGVESDIRVQGYLDKVSQIDDRITVVERKTTSASISFVSEYWSTLGLDTQIAGYAWALGKTLDHHVGLVVYEVLRKPYVPKIHRVKKVDTPYTLEEYEEKVIALLAKKPHVARKRIWFDTDAIEEWKYDVLATDDSIKTFALNQKGFEGQGLDGKYAWPRCQDGCSSFGGCVFLPVCSGQVNIDSFDLVTKV